MSDAVSMTELEAAISDTRALRKLRTLSQRQCLVDIKFRDLAYGVKVKGQKEPKSILQGVSGFFKAGRLNCIMGPSGAGKSSLLNVLAGLNTICKGQVIINGVEYEASKCGNQLMSKISSYIMQDDHLLGELTALETVAWAARFKSAASAEEATKIGMVILKLLGLKECAYRFVSQISGGQRKRVAVAVELVNYPPVLFLDECTTALDSTSCYRLMRLLKNMALSGVCVIATIHQPNSLVYRLFDWLYVMAPGGRLSFEGNPKDIPKALHHINVQCSITENPADVLFEKDNIERLAENWGDLATYEGFAKSKRLETVRFMKNKPRLSGVDLEGLSQAHRQSWLTEFSLLLSRGVLTASRDTVFTYGRFVAWVGCALMIGALYVNCGRDASQIYASTGLLYILIDAMLAAAGLMAVMQSENKMANLTREYVNSWYSPSTFYFTNAIIEGVLNMAATILFSLCGWLMTGQLNPAVSLVPAIIIYCLVVICTDHLMFIVCLQGDTQSNFQLPFMLTMIECCFSGYMLPLVDMLPGLNIISYAFYGTYAFSGIMRSVYSPWDGSDPELKCYAQPALCNRYRNGSDVLRMLKLEPGSPGQDMWIMSISAAVFFILGGPLLLKKMKSTKRTIARI